MRTPLPLRQDDPTTAGPFRLLGRLASGGMGVVYLARRQDRPESLVAMKLMRPEHAHHDVLRDRFRSEVAATRRLAQQPSTTKHVARLVEADAEAARPWLATEFVPGPSIADAVAERPLSEDEVAEVARALVEALVALHAEGLVHGDVKPANVVLGPDGVRLVDLGLSRDTDEPLAQAMGSPGWAPPEQHTADDDGMPTHVFGWGLTVAFAARGAHPFGEGTPEEITARMRSGAADLDMLPRPLRPLVSAALSPDPSARPTAAEAALALAGAAPLPPMARAADEGADATSALVAPTLVEDSDLLPWGSTEVDDAGRPSRRSAVAGALALGVAAAVLGALVAVGVADRPGPVAEPLTASPSSSATATASQPASTSAPSASPTAPARSLGTTGGAAGAAGGGNGSADGGPPARPRARTRTRGRAAGSSADLGPPPRDAASGPGPPYGAQPSSLRTMLRRRASQDRDPTADDPPPRVPAHWTCTGVRDSTTSGAQAR